MVDTLPSFVDMALTPREQDEDSNIPCSPDQPMYPYGLCLSFGDEQLEKLDMEDDCDVGDMIHMNCLAKVTSVSKNDTSDGPKKRVELQIIAIAAESDEDDEEEDSVPRKMNYGKIYNK